MGLGLVLITEDYHMPRTVPYIRKEQEQKQQQKKMV